MSANDFFETEFINRGDSVIRHHYQTLWNVYRCRRRAAVAAKVLLWFGTVLLLLMLSGVLRQKIDLLCEEYGRDLVRGACFFLALFLLFSAVMEYRHIVTGTFPDGDYSFYHYCGFNRRHYRLLRLLQALPLGCFSLLLSCLLCFPMIGTGPGRLLFAAGWLALLAAGCVLPDYLGKTAGRKNLLDAVRTGLLRWDYTGAMLAFSFFGAGKMVMFLWLSGLGVMLAILSPSVWIACWPSAWLSYYFTILIVNDYEKHGGFHQMLPCTYGRMILDDMRLSAIFCGGFLLITGASYVIARGISVESVLVPVLMLLYALSNHAALYLLLEPVIPAVKVTDTFAPVLILIAVLQVIPGVSLLLIMLIWSRRRKILNKSVPWGRRTC